jgi:hypothetical protein
VKLPTWISLSEIEKYATVLSCPFIDPDGFGDARWARLYGRVEDKKFGEGAFSVCI